MISSLLDLHSIASYLQRIGAEPRSLRTAVVKENQGAYWQDVAIIRFRKDGTVDAPADYAPTETEATMIRSDVLAAEWPTSVVIPSGWTLPQELQDDDPENVFEIRDTKGALVMVHQRTSRHNGDKRYIPWTYWSDGRWRKIEPEGPLPLYGMEKIKDNTTVFIHEGAKSARAMQRLTNPRTKADKEALATHPWGREMQGAAHIGWIGGALSPARTDWSPLAAMGVLRAYIVADNDAAGKAAIPKIAQRLRGITVFSIEFTEIWPASFDLADPFPKKMFSTLGGKRYYNGPSFRETVHPATWATDMAPNPKGKGPPVAQLRKEFADLWVWIEETDTFMCKEMPEINHSLPLFNSTVNPFSHVSTTGQLLTKSYKGRTAKICYRPDIPARIVTDRNTSAINMHTPSNIRPTEGDPEPWLEFLRYLVPDEEERKQVMRWCATLIARPDIRILYGMLLVSERQGMGKTTLGERILAPLVGLNNSGFPTERDIVESTFNGWIAHKRLVVVGEIYTGQSFKAYNNLKSYVTDKIIKVNEKFQRSYEVENWAHILACSNSKKALRIEDTDRRWFYPRLSERPWPREKFGELYQWLSSGGLGVVAQWAKDYGDYILPGELPPMTGAKQALIDESKGEIINHWISILEAAEGENEKVVFALSEVKEALKTIHGRIFETPLMFKKEALQRGWWTVDERVGIDGALSYVVGSPSFSDEIKDEKESPKIRSMIRSNLKRLKDRVVSGM